MGYFTTFQLLFDLPNKLPAKHEKKILEFLRLLDATEIGPFIDQKVNRNQITGRKGYNYHKLFAAIIYAFAVETRPTVRNIAEAFTLDNRYIFILGKEQPSYSTISIFIKEFIIEHIDFIYGEILKQIIKKMKINTSIAYIDGTKFEANANRYKFVWKPTKFHISLGIKVNKLISEYGIKTNYINSKFVTRDEISDLIDIVNNDTKILKREKLLKELSNIFLKILEYEEKEEICGERNSYFKTDKDATAMTLKRDYYSAQSHVFHAAYNLQLIVSDNIPLAYVVTQKRDDVSCFKDAFNHYFSLFNEYPKAICGDAGYGSLENYRYMKENKIKSFVKFQTWEKDINGTKPKQFEMLENDLILCLNGILGHPTGRTETYKGELRTFYQIEGCNGCEYKDYCMRFLKIQPLNSRTFSVRVEFEKLLCESERNLMSIEGIEARVNRSIQVEGVFGEMKQNLAYERVRRTGIKEVSGELGLVLLGNAIKKFSNYVETNVKPVFWKAGPLVVPTEKKKPNAKRLSKIGREINRKICQSNKSKH